MNSPCYASWRVGYPLHLHPVADRRPTHIVRDSTGNACGLQAFGHTWRTPLIGFPVAVKPTARRGGHKRATLPLRAMARRRVNYERGSRYLPLVSTPVPCMSQTPRLCRHQPPPRMHCCASLTIGLVVVGADIFEAHPARSHTATPIPTAPRTMVHLHCTAEVYRTAPPSTPEGSAERQARRPDGFSGDADPRQGPRSTRLRNTRRRVLHTPTSIRPPGRRLADRSRESTSRRQRGTRVR